MSERALPEYRFTPKPFTPFEDKAILMLAAKGAPASFIAQSLGRSRCSILGRAFRMRVKFTGRSTGRLFRARWVDAALKDAPE